MASSQTKFILVEDIQGDMDIRLLSRARAVFSAVIHVYSLNPPWSSDGSKENSNLLHGLVQVSLNAKFINKFKKKKNQSIKKCPRIRCEDQSMQL